MQTLPLLVCDGTEFFEPRRRFTTHPLEHGRWNSGRFPFSEGAAPAMRKPKSCPAH
jgi:hypothetical protein